MSETSTYSNSYIDEIMNRNKQAVLTWLLILNLLEILSTAHCQEKGKRNSFWKWQETTVKHQFLGQNMPENWCDEDIPISPMAQYACSTNSAISRWCIYAALTTDPIALSNCLQMLLPPPLETSLYSHSFMPLLWPFNSTSGNGCTCMAISSFHAYTWTALQLEKWHLLFSDITERYELCRLPCSWEYSKQTRRVFTGWADRCSVHPIIRFTCLKRLKVLS